MPLFAIEPDLQLTSKGPITNPRDKWCPKNLKPWSHFLDLVFENRNFLVGLGNRISQRLIADEKTLEYFLHNTVEDPARAILEQLKRVEAVASAYQLGDGIIIENHPHSISDVAEEVVARDTPASPPRTPNHRQYLHQLRPDHICVYHASSSVLAPRTTVYGCKYKPQTPNPELPFGGTWPRGIGSPTVCSAVGQCLLFTLMALGAPGERQQHGQDERQRAMDGLETWAEDFETTLRSVPESERSASSENTSCYVLTYEKVDRSPRRSPYVLRQQRRRRWNDGVRRGQPRKDVPDPSDNDEIAPIPPDTPTPWDKTGFGAVNAWRIGLIQIEAACRSSHTLVLGRLLDSTYPNVSLHGKGDAGNRGHHPASHDEWIRLLWEQLEQSLDDGIIPLDDGGARSVLFKVTLLAYGYTFVSRGTVQAFVEDLGHEAAVYRRLRPLQGAYVPVFLGAIDLRPMNKVVNEDERQKFLPPTIRALQALHQEGVIHRDVRSANVLFNPGTIGVMLIDFERASLLTLRRPLAELVSNKRKHRTNLKALRKATHNPGSTRGSG
ncbi:hypothetical protein PG988_000328 [Apiospora saccharicola]